MIKKSLLLLMVFLFFLDVISASSITRIFQSQIISPNDMVNVSLNVSITNSERFYAIEEYVPPSWNVSDTGGVVLNQTTNIIFWFVSENAQNITYTYSVRASSNSGEYSFNGTYMFENFSNPLDIGGQKLITINGTVVEPISPDSGSSSSSSGGGGGGGASVKQKNTTIVNATLNVSSSSESSDIANETPQNEIPQQDIVEYENINETESDRGFFRLIGNSIRDLSLDEEGKISWIIIFIIVIVIAGVLITMRNIFTNLRKFKRKDPYY